MSEKLFPISLLKGPVDERIRYFENYVVAHPTLITAYKELLERIDVTSDNNILLVYGPSGVGKSTLFSKIIKHIYEDNTELIREDRGFIPVVGTEAISPETGIFDWIDFYTRALHSANEPLVDHKVSFDEAGIKKSGSMRALRQSLENVLKYRKTKVVLIDEAQHMTKSVVGEV
ncbi:TniB family NTP-binding protein [Anaerobacillus sp. CMMVII]|uniref:TniB family NTP-binding protein n=1 Tax=Anaerobacillus sp. CMMVII TaxID=2755588 RepID=UPI0021B7137B|nr:TniB family NTP-binding protein [Anaerobacillus sp. CMMVII]